MGYHVYTGSGWRKAFTPVLRAWWLLDALHGRNGARHGWNAWLYLMVTEGVLLPYEMLDQDDAGYLGPECTMGGNRPKETPWD